jgi:hypothetical protein
MIKLVELKPSEARRKLPLPPGMKVAKTSVGWDGAAIRLLVPEGVMAAVFARTVQSGLASFPKTQTEHDYSPILTVSDSDKSYDIRLRGLTAAFPQIEVLPSNDILVVGSRCENFPDGTHELNATVFDSTGYPVRQFLLGDGINHVQADARGNIWVGYFDEGVFGNFGWQGVGSPLGAAGLSCFTGDGDRLWDFNPPEGFDQISDCYALNVSRSGVWTYYYTDFPFARIDSDWRVRAWPTKSSGGRTFALSGQTVVLYGGYDHDRNLFKLFKLGDENAELVGYVSLALPMDVELWKSIVIGRGAEIHVFYEDYWYRFSIESLD